MKFYGLKNKQCSLVDKQYGGCPTYMPTCHDKPILADILAEVIDRSSSRQQSLTPNTIQYTVACIYSQQIYIHYLINMCIQEILILYTRIIEADYQKVKLSGVKANVLNVKLQHS